MGDIKTLYLPYDATELDESSLEIVSRELGETEESKAEGLQILRTELKKCADIEPRLDDKFLISYLRVAKFDSTKALQRILNYYKQQERVIGNLKKLSISYNKARNLNHMSIYPYRAENNSLLINLNGGIDYSVYSLDERHYLETLVIPMLYANEVTQMCGITFIVDYTGFNFQGVLQHTPWKLKTMIDFSLNTLPLRFKGMHVVNAPSWVSMIYNSCKNFFPKKIQERVFMHPNDNWKSLHAHFPAEILPKKYGGHLDDATLLNAVEHFGLEYIEKQFHSNLKYGYIKTKQSRLNFRVLHED